MNNTNTNPSQPMSLAQRQEHNQQQRDLSLELAGPDRPGEGFLAKVSRLNEANATAAELLNEDGPIEPYR